MPTSSPEIPSPIPDKFRHNSFQVSHTGRPRVGSGAQLNAMAEEMAVQGQHLLCPFPDPGGPEHFALSPSNTARSKTLTGFIARCSIATAISDNTQSSIVLQGILCQVKQ